MTCLNLVWNAALRTFSSGFNAGSAANCLRMAFHDAGTYSTLTDTGGANGSIMLELAQSQNAGFIFCPVLITTIKAQVVSGGCPQITTADTVQVVGAAAVAFLGGPKCPLLMGRPDATSADSTAGLPNNCDTANQGLSRFNTMGFTNATKSLAVLSGAHNVGQSRTTFLPPCSKGLGPMTAASGTFNGHYYTEVVQRTGLGGFFSSDRNLNAAGAPTAALMQAYSSNHSAFLADWCAAYQEMSLLGVDPAPAGHTFLDGWLAHNSTPAPSTTTTPTPTPASPLMAMLSALTPTPNPTPTPTATPTPQPTSSLTAAAAYDRGPGYTLLTSYRCILNNAQGCEWYGTRYYPKCRTGFTADGCCTCTPTTGRRT